MSANPVNVYVIWYGNWNGTGSNTPATQSLVEDFISTFGGTPLAQVNTLYSDSIGPVSGNFLLGGPGGAPALQQAFSTSYDTTTPTTNQVSTFASTFPITDTGTSSGGTLSGNTLSGGTTTLSSGGTTNTKKNLTDGGVQKIVENALNNGQLPRDPNGVYFVFTSSDINESSEGGFCGAPSSDPKKSGFCGWHTHADMGGVDIKFAFVGNTQRCREIQSQWGCDKQATGPNSPSMPTQAADGTWTYYGGGDGMVNIIAHELSESITDPDLNAWRNSSGDENADVCESVFGPTSFLPTCGDAGSICTDAGLSAGSHYNQTFGNHSWLLQFLGKPNLSPPPCASSL
jgi:hypothetical protein